MTLTVPTMPYIADFDRTKDGTPAWVHWSDALKDWGKQGWAEAERLEDELDQLKADVVQRPVGMVVAELERRFPGMVACSRSELDALRAQVRELAEALEVAQDAMDERRSYVSGGEPSTCWQEMKYGKIWDEEDAKVSAALSRLASAGSK